MRRRKFLGYTGLTASMILVGGVLNPAELFAANSGKRSRIAEENRNGIRMNAGRCHDHRFLNNEPTPSFEREIFGI